MDVSGYIKDGRKTVTTAGTRVQLMATGAVIDCDAIVIQPLPTNTGAVVVGGATCTLTAASESGTRLPASSQGITIPVSDPSKIYIDAEVNGEGVMYTYVG